MSTVDGTDRRSFWATKDIDKYEGAGFQLPEYMSRNQFKSILKNILYMDREAPVLKD